MVAFSAYDATMLAYRGLGDGPPVVCLPGGPMQDAVYLDDLGGPYQHARLILLDPRGTGASETPRDLGSYRCDRLVEDVEALREQLGVDRIDVLGHSAGANLAVSYAVRHPDHVERLLLITPSVFAVGLEITSDDRRDMVQRRSGEPWFGPAAAAFEAIASGQATDADWESITPFTYGRWDDAARRHHVQQDAHRNVEAAEIFSSDGAYDAESTRAALASLDLPVLIVGGGLDISAPPRVMKELAALFPRSTLVTQPGAGHFPWVDDPAAFRATVGAFLA